MKKESSTNLQKYSGIAEQMIKMSLDERDNHMYMREVIDFMDKFKKVVS